MANQAGRRQTISNSDNRGFEMRPLTSSSTSSSSSPRSSVNSLIDMLKSTTQWDDRVKFGRSRKEKKKLRSRFAVNVPTRLIFHLIIVFFLIPLVLGTALLIRALFFGLKEDDEHPLHKKIPKSHLKTTNAEKFQFEKNHFEGDDMIDKQSSNLNNQLNETDHIVSNLNASSPIQGSEDLNPGESGITNSSLAASTLVNSNITSSASQSNSTQEDYLN